MSKDEAGMLAALKLHRKNSSARRPRSSTVAARSWWAMARLLGLMKTHTELGMTFEDCLGCRLKTPDSLLVAYLPDLLG
jgi:hypothetical protein